MPPGRALYDTHCASCHGPNGDGDGTGRSSIAPPAVSKPADSRSGTRPKRCCRSISIGIPGTLRCRASTAHLSEGRAANLLADFVRSLGPEVTPTSPNAHDPVGRRRRARIVRGGLAPDHREGLPQRPRGLLAGLPDGFTFEYRVDDVRLLGVRQGASSSAWTGSDAVARRSSRSGRRRARSSRRRTPGDVPTLAAGERHEAAEAAGTWTAGERRRLSYRLLRRRAAPYDRACASRAAEAVGARRSAPASYAASSSKCVERPAPVRTPPRLERRARAAACTGDHRHASFDPAVCPTCVEEWVPSAARGSVVFDGTVLPGASSRPRSRRSTRLWIRASPIGLDAGLDAMELAPLTFVRTSEWNAEVEAQLIAAEALAMRRLDVAYRLGPHMARRRLPGAAAEADATTPSTT